MVAKKPGPALCPDCYLTNGIDTPMIIRAGSALKCQVGHTWGSGGDSDNGGSISGMEIYDQRQAMARHKRSEMAKKEDPSFNEPAGLTVSAIVKSNTGDEVIIDQETRGRITALIGEFGDASTLFGAIYSLVEDIKTLQEELRIAKSAPSSKIVLDANDGMQAAAAGDMAVTVLIPERHVIPLQDIAEAQGTNVPEYVNSIFGSGLDASWFY
jgi:hypothetical protein